MLRAAERLDPAVENLQGNLAAARSRAARPVNLPLPPGARARLKAVEGRLRIVAKRTATLPAPGRISFCMIVRDEEEMLPDCLASVRDGVDELIVVDTGSTDRTVEIAESFGATVLHVPWTGDFSARPQRRLRRAPPATGSSGSTPTSASRRATPSACAS